MVQYYNTLEPVPDIHVNGDLVKVEAAEIYCTVMPAQIVQMLMGADSHPLNHFRTNVNVQMFEELYDTYEIKEGDGMYLPEENRIRFWGE